MRFTLQILSLLAIHWTTMGDKRGAHGNEGGQLDITCPYADGYQNLPKYLCRHPCQKKDVLIRAEKSDIYESFGRFSLYDNSHGRSFTATIRKLSLRDGGLYYCGIETWGRDKMNKVQVTVSKAVRPVSTLSPTAGTTGNGGDSPHRGSSRTPGTAFTDLFMETATLPLPFVFQDGNKGGAGSLVVVGSALGVLACLFLAAIAVLIRRRSVSHSLALKPALKPATLSVPVNTAQDEEDPEHVYHECAETAVYSTISLSQADSEEGYCTVQFPDLPPGAEENNQYSLVMPH